MLQNKDNASMKHVEFVSYTGKFPNLCRGVLTLKIDGELVTFGHAWKKGKPMYKPFWSSGGNVSFDKNWNASVSSGRWNICEADLPEQFKKYSEEIDYVFNGNVKYGCCGGCV